MPNNARRVTAFAVLRKLVFCMWPEESSYFNRGVVEGILTKNHNARLSGYIFVDFSVSFLRLFLEKDWIDYLASTDMGLF